MRACARCARRHGTFHHTRACFSQRALTNLQYTSRPINHTKHTRQRKHRKLVPTSSRVVLHEARRHAHSSLPRDRHDATSYHAFARDTKPHRPAQHKGSHQGPVARTSTGCYTRGRTRNVFFTMCAHPVGCIDEARLHYPRTIPSTRVT